MVKEYNIIENCKSNAYRFPHDVIPTISDEMILRLRSI